MNYRLLIIVVLMVQGFLLTGCNTGSEKNRTQLQESPNAVRPAEPDLIVSIHQAALEGRTDLVKRLLDEGVGADIADEDGRTPLMYAAFNGHNEIIKLLLDQGAKVNSPDLNGRTALMMASSGPYPAAVKILLDHGADPNIADKEERFTALMYAAAEGQTDVVKLLLAYRADPSAKDADGDDALTFAVNNGHAEVAALLKKFVK